MNEDLNVYDHVAAGDFEEINSWNREKIWKYGGLFNSKVIMERYVEAPVSSDTYVNYLKNKYKEIYRL